ncbi:MAG: SPOR domain-containing protein [Saprospiraceae bacterium]|nr:SPOR domain-containing protein [Saprospiraceae bacterium]
MKYLKVISFSQRSTREVVSVWVFFMVIFGFQQQLSGQEIQLNEDPRIAQMFRNWTNNNRANPKVDGWRVQIMATADRQQVEDARTRFRIQYPEVPAEWIHEKPYYKLRVGAFRSRLEAQRFLATLSGYAGAYPARDANIHPRDFLEQ